MKSEKELREIDVWIGEHVMGYRWFLLKDGVAQLELPAHWLSNHAVKILERRPAGETDDLSVPHYTTDPAAAMLVFLACWKLDADSLSEWLRQNEPTPENICKKAKSMFQKV